MPRFKSRRQKRGGGRRFGARGRYGVRGKRRSAFGRRRGFGRIIRRRLGGIRRSFRRGYTKRYRRFSKRQGKLARAKVYTRFEMTDIWNNKEIFYGYSVGNPPTEPPRQDWPSVFYYQDSPRQELKGFYSAQQANGAAQPLAGPSDRTTNYVNEERLQLQYARDAYDYVYRLKPYFTHHRIFNPNNHPIWIKIDVIAPRMPLTATPDPDNTISNYLITQYESCAVIQYNKGTSSLSTSNIDWKSLDTAANSVTGASIHGLFPKDRTWAARQKWKTLSMRKKVLVPAGSVYKFRVFHRGMGPLRLLEFQQPSFIPFPYTDRIIKVSAMSTIGMTPYADDSTNDRIHTDFVTYGVWTHSVKTMTCAVLNKPVFIQSMNTAQISTAVAAPSVNPQITVSQQVMGPSPP